MRPDVRVGDSGRVRDGPLLFIIQSIHVMFSSHERENQFDRQGKCRPERAHERQPVEHVLEQGARGRGVGGRHEDLDVDARDPRLSLLADDLEVGEPVFQLAGDERLDGVDRPAAAGAQTPAGR